MSIKEMADKILEEKPPEHLTMGQMWRKVGVVVAPIDGRAPWNRSEFSSNAEHPGMDATQALLNVILDQSGLDKDAPKKYRDWLEKKNNQAVKPSVDNAWGLAMTPEEKAKNWVRSTVESALLWQKMLNGKATKEECFDKMAKSEKLWKKIGVTKTDRVIFHLDDQKPEVLTINPRPDSTVDRYLDGEPMSKWLPFGLSLKLGPSMATLTATAALLAACGGPARTTEPAPAPTERPTANTPTQVVTRVPSATPRSTETNAPTPTKVEELYPIDMAKLDTTPKSYDYLTSHLDEYVEAPDPLTDINAFNDWWKNKLIPALGDETKLERNIDISDGVYVAGQLMLGANTGTEKPLMGQPEFFYFKREGKVYPVMILSTVSYMSGGQELYGRTIVVILTEGKWGWGALENITNGKLIIGVILYPSADAKFIPDNCKQFASAGLDGSVYEDYWRTPAAGIIQTKP